MTPEAFMRIALAEARKGDSPYGAVIVKDNVLMAKAYNTVKRDTDPSAHAEMNAIRILTAQRQRISLSGHILYTTCEPCPMCTAVCIWTGISEIICGASIEDLMNLGVSQINLSCETMISKSFQNIKVTKGVLKEECLKLFK